MKIVYWGSSAFGIRCLETLKEIGEIVAVVTSPDKPKGRHLKITPGPVKIWAQKENIVVLQPEELKNNTELSSLLLSMKPDFFIVLSYGKIIPENYLKIPAIASLNIHPSLLPKYRGPAPMEWVLINGEKETGVTVILMNKDIDAGKIICKNILKIEQHDDIFTLREKLSVLATETIKEAIKKVLSGYQGEEQQGDVSYAPKLKKSDGLIKWENSAVSIHNRVRGLADWPGAFTFLNLQNRKILLKIKKSSIEKEEGNYGKPGTFVDLNKKILVACGTGILKIEQIQQEGKKPQSAIEYLNGHINLLKQGYLG